MSEIAPGNAGDAAPEADRLDQYRSKRGRLSTIDTLPEECDEDIVWANEQLRDRKMPQTEIHRQFNARLADKGIKGISVGAFSRHSMRLATEIRKMEASRRITDVVLARLAPGERTDGMIAATELLKYRILEMVMAEEQPDPKLLNVASLALARLSSTAAREVDAKRQEKAEQREEEARLAQEAADRAAAAKAAEQADQAVTQIATEAGLGADRLRDLRRGLLGLAV